MALAMNADTSRFVLTVVGSSKRATPDWLCARTE